MDSNLETQLLDSFLQAAGSGIADLAGREDLAGLLPAVTGSDSVANGGQQENHAAQAQGVEAIFGDSASFAGISQRSQPIHNSSSGTGVSIGSLTETFLESGFGIVPLITGLLGLFGGDSTQPAALEKYEMPSSIAFTSALTPGGLVAADFDQMGAPRVYERAVDSAANASGSPMGAGAQGGNSGGGSANTTPITVNVQTMDARSFLDNSEQIAQAVRGAMLNLSSINDMVNEL